MSAAGLARSLGGATKGANGWWHARCPAHDDGKASLGLHDTADGGVAWKCMAGCGSKAVGDELRKRGLLPEQRRTAKDEAKAKREIACTYDYRDEAGGLLFQVVRYRPKGFSPRRPDGKGGWLWSLGGARRVLYRLPELLAADRAEPVFVCEGEKDVDRLRGMGLVATTSPQGAGKWAKADRTALASRHAVVVPDNDAAGRQHAEDIARDLAGKAASVRVLPLPGLPEKGDVSDWVDRGGTAEKLRVLAAEQPEATATAGNRRQDIYLDASRVNENARACAELLREDIYLRGIAPVVLTRAEDLTRARQADDDEPDQGVVLGGVRHTRGCLLFGEPSPEQVMYRLDERALFHRFDARSARWVATSCPAAMARRIVGAANEIGFRPCGGIVTTPLFVDGRIVAERGYDREFGVILDLNGSMPAIPEKPTQAEARRALDTLLRPFRGYLESGDEEARLRLRAAVGAGALTAVLRPSLPSAPAVMVEANMPGAGKGKAARALGVIATGRLPSIITEGPDDKETEKRLATAILSGTQALLLDNVQRTLASSALESGLTEGFATIRVFGKLVDVTVPCSALVLVTANNASMRSDMLRRTLPIRIVAETDRPELRRFTFDPYEEALRLRFEIVAAALTVARAWWLARDTEDGRRIRQTTLGSFEAWADLVGGAIEWLTGFNPVALIEERKAEDPGRGAERRTIEALHELFGDREWSAKEAAGEPGKVGKEPGVLFTAATGLDPEIWSDVMSFKGERPSAVQVGNWLRKRKDSVFGGLQLTGRHDRNGVAQWRLRGLRGFAGAEYPRRGETSGACSDKFGEAGRTAPAAPRSPRGASEAADDGVLL